MAFLTFYEQVFDVLDAAKAIIPARVKHFFHVVKNLVHNHVAQCERLKKYGASDDAVRIDQSDAGKKQTVDTAHEKYSCSLRKAGSRSDFTKFLTLILLNSTVLNQIFEKLKSAGKCCRHYDYNIR